MQAVPVSFGAATGFSLRHDADKARLLGELRDLAGVHVPDRGARTRRYCGAEHAREIRGGGYVASVRSRGNPYYLYLTRVDGAGVCAFVDRKVQDGHFYPRVVLTRLCFDERAFDGTVVEGDLLRVSAGGGASGAQWAFVCGDLLADRGVDLRRTGDALDARLARLARLLSPTLHRPDLTADCCLLRSKQYFQVAQLRDVVEQQLLPGALDYDVNGVAFRSLGPLGEDAGDIVFAIPRSAQAVDAAEQHRRRPLRSPGAVDDATASTPAPASAGYDDDYDGREDGHDGRAGENDPPASRAFFIRRTDMPDVYELYDTAEGASKGHAGAPIAGVPTLRVSEALAAAPDGAPVMFSFNSRFDKWIPT